MPTRIEISPAVLTSAIEKAGYAVEEFVIKFDKQLGIDKWIRRERQPTVKQLEAFSKKVRVPFGYLLLGKIPEDRLTIPFFRTGKTTPDYTVDSAVFDTVRLLQSRQEWLSDYLRDNDAEPLPFAGKFGLQDSVTDIVADMRTVLQLPLDWAADLNSTDKAKNYLADKLEDTGITVVFNGVVGQNNTRSLSREKCRGFVLADNYAPFLFVNNNDWKSAQIFTLMHEAAHIWLGASAGFDLKNILPADHPLEVLCDAVAAELLVPADLLHAARQTEQNFNKLAKRFKVSPLVIARRLKDLGFIEKEVFFAFYNARAKYFREQEKTKKDKDTGGNYYATAGKRVSRHFFGYVEQALRQNRITYLEAYRLTGMRGKTFNEFINRNT